MWGRSPVARSRLVQSWISKDSKAIRIPGGGDLCDVQTSPTPRTSATVRSQAQANLPMNQYSVRRRQDAYTTTAETAAPKTSTSSVVRQPSVRQRMIQIAPSTPEPTAVGSLYPSTTTSHYGGPVAKPVDLIKFSSVSRQYTGSSVTSWSPSIQSARTWTPEQRIAPRTRSIASSTRSLKSLLNQENRRRRCSSASTSGYMTVGGNSVSDTARLAFDSLSYHTGESPRIDAHRTRSMEGAGQRLAEENEAVSVVDHLSSSGSSQGLISDIEESYSDEDETEGTCWQTAPEPEVYTLAFIDGPVQCISVSCPVLDNQKTVNLRKQKEAVTECVLVRRARKLTKR